jgi:aromatic ring hydroxylase
MTPEDYKKLRKIMDEIVATKRLVVPSHDDLRDAERDQKIADYIADLRFSGLMRDEPDYWEDWAP